MITGAINEDIFVFVKRKAQTPSAIIITTNTCLRSDGMTGIMGAGIAKQARELCPEAEYRLGELINRCGECVGELGRIQSDSGQDIILLAFPTKRDFRDKSDIELIRQSAQQLVFWMNQHPNVKYAFMPPVGCGLGGLDWATQVEPVLSSMLRNQRFVALIKR